MLEARLVSRRTLPGVRSGSALGWLGGELAIVQDDRSALALLDVASGASRSIALPTPDEGGDKSGKPDFEALLATPAGLWILGSGSTPRRERIARVPQSGPATVFPAPSLYARLRAAVPGPCLNLEGAALVGDHVVLAHRGNGGPDARDATVRLAAAPFLRWLESPGDDPGPGEVTTYELGEIDGVRLSFTDLAVGLGGELLFSAAAEDTPDAIGDGPCAGSAVGTIGRDGHVRLAIVEDGDGRVVRSKIEGIVASGPGLLAVTDADDPRSEAELFVIDVRESG